MAVSSLPLAVVALLVLFLLGVGSGKQQYALNVPRVLLPLVPASGIKSNFTITSTHGCFSWSADGSLCSVKLCKAVLISVTFVMQD